MDLGFGADAASFLGIFFNSKNSNLINNQRFNKKTSSSLIGNVVIIADSGGVDTLKFSEYDSGVTLDITLLNSEQTIDTAGTKVMLQGIFEVLVGSEFDDEFTVSPLSDTARHVDGRDGSDILNFIAAVPGSVDDGSTITTPGFADVTYVNIETVNLSVVSGINESDTKQPVSFSLSQNYPNPFNPVTIIKYQIPELGLITLKVYDVLGSEIATLVNEEQPIGNYTVEFDATELSSGIYFYRIQAGSFVETKKMMLLK